MNENNESDRIMHNIENMIKMATLEAKEEGISEGRRLQKMDEAYFLTDAICHVNLAQLVEIRIGQLEKEVWGE